MSEAQPLCTTSAKLNLGDRVLGDVEKDSFIALPGKGGQNGLLHWKATCPNQGGFDEEFYSNSSRVEVADKIRVCAGSQVVGLLILVSFSGPFNLASDGFLAAPPMISNCLNLPFGTQGRSWRLESCLQKQGT